jgi:hypothetical protein
MEARVSDVDTNREVARTALEQVCSRGDMTLAGRCYADEFADYVGSRNTTVSMASSDRRRCIDRCSTT